MYVIHLYKSNIYALLYNIENAKDNCIYVQFQHIIISYRNMHVNGKLTRGIRIDYNII